MAKAKTEINKKEIENFVNSLIYEYGCHFLDDSKYEIKNGKQVFKILKSKYYKNDLEYAINYLKDNILPF